MVTRDSQGRFAATMTEVAALMETVEGRHQLEIDLGVRVPIDTLRLADPKYLASLSAETVAENWPAIVAAQDAAKETR